MNTTIDLAAAVDRRKSPRITEFDSIIAKLYEEDGLGLTAIYRAINQPAWRNGEHDRISVGTVHKRLRALKSRDKSGIR
jgi:hypothetical protein